MTDASVVSLGPQDRVVISFDGTISEAVKYILKKQASDALGIPIKSIFILDKGMSMIVVARTNK